MVFFAHTVAHRFKKEKRGGDKNCARVKMCFYHQNHLTSRTKI